MNRSVSARPGRANFWPRWPGGGSASGADAGSASGTSVFDFTVVFPWIGACRDGPARRQITAALPGLKSMAAGVLPGTHVPGYALPPRRARRGENFSQLLRADKQAGPGWLGR